MFEVNNENSKESHEINRNLVALKSHNIYFSQGHPVTPKASLYNFTIFQVNATEVDLELLQHPRWSAL